MDYYLFYLDIYGHLTAMEQRAKQNCSKESFQNTKKLLCNSYLRYKNREFSWEIHENQQGKLSVDGAPLKTPTLPLPTIRYSDTICEEMFRCHRNLQSIRPDGTAYTEKRKKMDDVLRGLVKNLQLGNISEKGEKQQQDLCSNVPEIRMEFLMFPLKTDFDRNTFSLLMQNYLDYQVLEEKNLALEKVQREKQELIDHHAHTWKHIAFPNTVYHVAETLFSHPLNQLSPEELGARLLVAYEAQLLLTGNLELLEIKYSSNPKSAWDKLRKTLGTGEDVRDMFIGQVIAQNLKMRLFALCANNAVGSGKHQKFRSEPEMQTLYDLFVQEFLVETDTNLDDIVAWFSENIYPLSITFSEKWQRIYLKELETAYVVFSDIFTNLILNALNYGVKGKDGYLNIVFSEEEREGKSFLSLSVTNPVEADSAFLSSSGHGLTSVNGNLMWMNTRLKRSGYLLTSEKEGVFSLKALFFEGTLLKKRS